MQNIDSFLAGITREKELLSVQEREIKWLKKQITEKLHLLTQKIDTIFTTIKEYKSPIEASLEFDNLNKIQCLVSILISENEIELSDELWKFYKDFDHIEEPGEKDRLFNRIKKENYRL